MAVVILDGLQGMGVVADEDIGTGIYELTGFLSLLGNGLQRVLSSPVKTDDDVGIRLRLAQTDDSLAKGIDAFLTDTWFGESEGQVFDSFPCITWQMPVPLSSRFCRSIECLFTLYSAKIHIFLVTTNYSSSEGIKNQSP